MSVKKFNGDEQNLVYESCHCFLQLQLISKFFRHFQPIANFVLHSLEPSTR